MSPVLDAEGQEALALKRNTGEYEETFKVSKAMAEVLKMHLEAKLGSCIYMCSLCYMLFRGERKDDRQ